MSYSKTLVGGLSVMVLVGGVSPAFAGEQPVVTQPVIVQPAQPVVVQQPVPVPGTPTVEQQQQNQQAEINGVSSPSSAMNNVQVNNSGSSIVTFASTSCGYATPMWSAAAIGGTTNNWSQNGGEYSAGSWSGNVTFAYTRPVNGAERDLCKRMGMTNLAIQNENLRSTRYQIEVNQANSCLNLVDRGAKNLPEWCAPYVQGYVGRPVVQQTQVTPPAPTPTVTRPVQPLEKPESPRRIKE